MDKFNFSMVFLAFPFAPIPLGWDYINCGNHLNIINQVLWLKLRKFEMIQA